MSKTNGFIDTLKKYGTVNIPNSEGSDPIVPNIKLNEKYSTMYDDPEEEIIDIPEGPTEGTRVGAKEGEIEYSFVNPNTKYFYSLDAINRPSFTTVSTKDDSGYRNNNPGNLRVHSGWGGKTKNGFIVFSSLEAGWEALKHDFEIKKSGKSSFITPEDSVRKYISVYAPSNENDTSAYINYIQRNGIDIDKSLNSLSKEEVNTLLKTIVKRESPNSYEYLFDPKVRNTVLSSLFKNKVPKYKRGGIIYVKRNKTK